MGDYHDCHVGTPNDHTLLVFLACGVALALAVQLARREPPVNTSAAPVISKPASDARAQSQAALGTAQAEANAVVDALIGLPASPESSDGVPTFDVARIDTLGRSRHRGPGGAGRNGGTARNGEVHDRAVADKSGQFVLVPPKLPCRHLRPDAALESAGWHGGHLHTARDGGAGAEIYRGGRSWHWSRQTNPPSSLCRNRARQSRPARWSWRRSRSRRGGKFHVAARRVPARR